MAVHGLVRRVSTTTIGPPDNCGPGAECDCSRIEDPNGDEYFRCVTNPACEHCFHTAFATLVSAATTNYHTASPGTYTETHSDGLVVVIIVTAAPSTTASPPPAGTTVSSSVLLCPAWCDCAEIEDEESEEYFQCITNPVCEVCVEPSRTTGVGTGTTAATTR
ncbi:hypothetical protein S7711_02824 [Stachybotrys chartarum IBT 7711]|uniref:Uncharacterized protein n=1 Tax=Stachybotrys chartarum (strain CBS 109288 / IBT 7711) TaxID=1280523 RepID=A0A084AH41_STACB|nr:hypothetical protein S7711_02824 [Stachybotrys chartarum IBT 7711]KFA56121.1 hypothetical protein S40293_00135 [Stachybotrys chartarum IBT 40293]